jgi:hypothetical protein
MHNNKLITILKHFNKPDLNQFHKYIVSPYFNKSKQLIQFYEIILKGINSPKASLLGKEQVWKKLFKDQKYNDVRFRKLNSDLLKLIEAFFSQKKFDKDKLQQVAYLIESVGAYGLDKLYRSVLRTAVNLSNSHPYEDSEYFLKQFQIQKNYFEITQNEFKHSAKLNINEIDENLTNFFISEKLRYYCTILSQKQRGHDYELSMINEVLKFSKKRKEIIPAISIYYQIYLTYFENDNLEHYFNLKKLLKEYGSYFHSVEAKTLYDSAINYCAIKLNKGLSNFLNEIFEVYEDYLSKEAIYVEGELDPFHFKNIVTVALRLGKFDWTEKFITENKERIPITSRENAYSFNQARLHYYRKEYEQVISLLQEVEYEDIVYSLSSKSLLIATYYENDEIEPLYSLLESFRVYLNRRKDIPERWKKNHLNLVKFTKKLIRIIPGDEKAIKKIKEEIENTPDGIADAKWLQSRIAELEK